MDVAPSRINVTINGIPLNDSESLDFFSTALPNRVVEPAQAVGVVAWQAHMRWAA